MEGSVETALLLLLDHLAIFFVQAGFLYQGFKAVQALQELLVGLLPFALALARKTLRAGKDAGDLGPLTC